MTVSCSSLTELLTAAEIADYLGIHRETVYDFTRRGAIPGRKVGGSWRYNPAEVLAALETQTLRTREVSR